jgi:hypothetical protein
MSQKFYTFVLNILTMSKIKEKIITDYDSDVIDMDYQYEQWLKSTFHKSDVIKNNKNKVKNK